MSALAIQTGQAPRPHTAGAEADRADRATLVCLRESLREARRAGDHRSPFAIIAASLGELGVELPERSDRPVDLQEARNEWLQRVRSSRRAESTVTAYRIALDDFLKWLRDQGELGRRCREQTVVAYLEDYRRRNGPAAATYYRRFTLLRRFFRWLSSRSGTPDPFLELEPPRKPAQAADWLTPAEFGRLLRAAAEPVRAHRGMPERDRLVLLTLVVTGLRRLELIGLDWGDVDLEGERPSLLVRSGKGGRPRRQPLVPALASELSSIRARERPHADSAVFRGLRGGRLQATILAGIIRRASIGAGLEKRVTAHTLRHTAATWLRSATGDARLVAEYLGHADLSTVHRYAHVASEELAAAAATIADIAALRNA
jgi:integrase/recombinase XerC